MKQTVKKNQVRMVTTFLIMASSFCTAMASNPWAGLAVFFGFFALSGVLESIFMFLDTEEREVG